MKPKSCLLPFALGLVVVQSDAQTTPAEAPPATPISAEHIKGDVKKHSSDAFLGRGPGELGEEKTIAYLADFFAKTGSSWRVKTAADFKTFHSLGWIGCRARRWL